MTDVLPGSNPYVGPRTFDRAHSRVFFGRDQESRDLLARVVSERLLLFYAQSGAGKSSLINTRLVPGLEEEGFAVLPVARVSGEMPPDIDAVNNIFLFNLMLDVDNCGNQPNTLARLSLSEFLERLTTEDGKHWCYDAEAAPSSGDGAQPYVLIVDQFEEIVTAHPGRWREREAFFVALDLAMAADPNLWIVLTLREDYLAALDPFATLMSGRLRARYYMERMGFDAAVEAVRKPAELAGRSFEPGVAEKLVRDLCQVRVPGQEGTIEGKYVEPVQLQVVCYQLWEDLPAGDGENRDKTINEKDLKEAGDVNEALTEFYRATLASVLADSKVAAAGVTESRLRQWFDQELITETGTRSTVFRNEGAGRTGTLPNVAVDALIRRFLVRVELRAGGEWIELVHDRLVEPIRADNAVWSQEHRSAFQVQASLWDSSGRKPALLLKDRALTSAEAEVEGWRRDHPGQKLPPMEDEFLRQSQTEAANQLREQSKHWSRIGRWAILETLGLVLGGALLVYFVVAVTINPDAGPLAALAMLAGAVLFLVGLLFGVRVIIASLSIAFRSSRRTDEMDQRKAQSPKAPILTPEERRRFGREQ